mmetsp:Transcript_13028/g.26700  ORF Transcript_13028/g.26700 Transcript_13028/m.26700 type:complete len:303 (-) Transcript_13028:3319-4227(-)
MPLSLPPLMRSKAALRLDSASSLSALASPSSLRSTAMVLGWSSSASLRSFTLSSSSSKSLLRASSRLLRSPKPLLLAALASLSLFSLSFMAPSFSFWAFSMSFLAWSAVPAAASSSELFSSSLLSKTSILLRSFLSLSPPPLFAADPASEVLALPRRLLPLLPGLLASSSSSLPFFVSSLSLCPAAALLSARFWLVSTMILFSSSATLALSSPFDFSSPPLRSLSLAPALRSLPSTSSFSLTASSRLSLVFLTSSSSSAISSACFSFSALALFRAFSLFSLLALAACRACLAPAISSMRLLS